MGVFVKICGLTRQEDVEAVAALRPDAMGFNFWPRSPRAVRPADVAAWTSTLPDEIRRGLSGNLCRCTGYQNIVKAVRTAADKLNAQREAAE